MVAVFCSQVGQVNSTEEHVFLAEDKINKQSEKG